MMAIAEEFTPEKSYNQLILTAVLTKDGQLVDEVVVDYDCAEIDQALCLDIPQAETVEKTGAFTAGKLILFGLAALGTLLIGGLALFLYYRKKLTNNTNE
jgi:hypothetical protein